MIVGLTIGEIALYVLLGGYLLIGAIVSWAVWDVWISGNTDWLYRGLCEDCVRSQQQEDEAQRALLLEGIQRFSLVRLLLAVVLVALIGGWPVLILITLTRKGRHG